MAMNYSEYPEDWKDIRTRVLERAENADDISQCECLGECGREHKGTRCPHVQYGRLTTKSKYKVILTTAHLCHTPKCDRLDHLKSMCQPCHQIFDLRERQKSSGNKIYALKSSAVQLSERSNRGGRPPKEEKVQLQAASQPLPIPNGVALLLPVLKLLADGGEHSSQEIRERLRVQFEIATIVRIQKLANGKTEFDSNIDLALACLQGARGVGTKAIERSEKKMYRIKKLGKAILNTNPSVLTIKDLKSWKLH
jgi:hypothetical protein